MEEKAIVEKIKQIRLNKKITLKALANETGLTEGYLSRIENSENAPPIATLIRIAQGLGIDISYLLLPENNDNSKIPKLIIDREGSDKEQAYPHGTQKKTDFGFRYEARAVKKRGKNMEPYVIISNDQLGESFQHDGEEFGYVLEGEVEFFYGSEKYILKKGDSVYFDATIPHYGRSVGNAEAKVLTVIYSYRKI